MKFHFKLIPIAILTILITIISIPAFALQEEIVITSRVGAYQSATLAFARNDVGVLIQVDSTIASGETVAIEQQNTDDSWGSIYVDGTEQVLTDTNTQVIINGINRFRLNKSVTAVAVGVKIITE